MDYAGWILVCICGLAGGIGLVPLFAKGSVQFPVIQWFLLLVLGGAGACILTLGLVKVAKRHQLTTSRGRVAEGRVVAQRLKSGRSSGSRAKDRDDSVFSDSGSESWTEYCPIVEFQSEQGKAVRFEGCTYSKDKNLIKKGTSVKVYYDPENPSDAFIGYFSEMWLVPLAMSLAGLILLASGVGGFAACRRALAADLGDPRSPEFMEHLQGK